MVGQCACLLQNNLVIVFEHAPLHARQLRFLVIACLARAFREPDMVPRLYTAHTSDGDVGDPATAQDAVRVPWLGRIVDEHPRAVVLALFRINVSGVKTKLTFRFPCNMLGPVNSCSPGFFIKSTNFLPRSISCWRRPWSSWYSIGKTGSDLMSRCPSNTGMLNSSPDRVRRFSS